MTFQMDQKYLTGRIFKNNAFLNISHLFCGVQNGMFTDLGSIYPQLQLHREGICDLF